jgi:hypothetical protein
MTELGQGQRVGLGVWRKHEPRIPTRHTVEGFGDVLGCYGPYLLTTIVVGLPSWFLETECDFTESTSRLGERCRRESGGLVVHGDIDRYPP